MLRSKRRHAGFMLPELLICVAMLAIAIAALLGAFLGQLMLNEHARNLTWAIHDANRVMERLRQENTATPTNTCILPDALPPAGFTSWNAWLAASVAAGGGGGKSIQPNPNIEEQIVVTCQNSDGTAYCEKGSQVGDGEWDGHPNGVVTAHDPIRVTVSVCWRHRTRVIGECVWNNGALQPSTAVVVPNDVTEVIDSPAMLVTLMTCRR